VANLTPLAGLLGALILLGLLVCSEPDMQSIPYGLFF
jgi:hypothetical protein